MHGYNPSTKGRIENSPMSFWPALSMGKTLCHEKIKSNYDCLTCSVSIKFSSYVYNWNDLNSIGKGQSAMDVKQPGISSYSGTFSPIKVRQGIPVGVESSKSS